MAYENSNDDFLSFMESDWISSTPIPLGRHETKFNSTFDETLDSDYKSAISVIFTNQRKSLSTIGTKGSSNVSESELSSLASLTDDETENANREDDDDRSEIDDFDEHEESLRKNILQNTEKYQSSDKNDFYKTSLGRLSGDVTGFQNNSSEDSSFIEQNSENSDVFEKNQSSGNSDIYETSPRKDKKASDVKPDFQSWEIEENSVPEQTRKGSSIYDNASHRLENKQNTKTFTEECALKKDGSSVKSCDRIFISSPTDFARNLRSPLPSNASSSNLKRKVQENLSSKSAPFHGKRQKLNKSNPKRENYVLDSATKSAPPSPISHSRTESGFYLNSLKKERKSLSYFYNKFKKNISESRRLRVSNSIRWGKSQNISKAQSLKEIESESFKPVESNTANNDNFLILSNESLVSHNELAYHPCETSAIKEESQDVFESQTSKTDISSYSPLSDIPVENVSEVKDDLTIVREESLRENSVTVTESDASMSQDLLPVLNDPSHLCSVINETKLYLTDSDLGISSNFLSISKELICSEGAGNFNLQKSSDSFLANLSPVETNVCKTTCQGVKTLSEITPNFQYCKTEITGQITNENSDVYAKNQSFDKREVHKTSLTSKKIFSDEKPDFQSFEKNSLSGQKNSNSDVSVYIPHRFSEKLCVETLQQECSLNGDEKSRKNSNETLTPNIFDLERFQRSSMSSIISSDQRDVLQSDHTWPFDASNSNLCEKKKIIFQPESLQQIAANSLKPFGSSEGNDDYLKRTSKTSVPDQFTCNPFINCLKREEHRDKFESQTSKRDSDLMDIRSNSSSISKELSFPDEVSNFDSQASTMNSTTNPSTISNLICCPFCKNAFSEASPSESNLVEVTTDNDNNDQTAEERHPSVDTILGLFSTDNNLSKNILLAILSKDSMKGATYTEIVKYFREERIYSAKLSECIKTFLQTAVDANILRVKRKRYFLVSRDGVAESQMIQLNASEWERNSKNESLDGQVFSSRTKSKSQNENTLKHISLELSTRKKRPTRKTRQMNKDER